MEPLALNIEFLLPLRDCRQVYCHFEKVFQRENAAPPSRSRCWAVPKRMRAQIRKLHVISSNHSTRVQDRRRAAPWRHQQFPADRAGDCDRCESSAMHRLRRFADHFFDSHFFALRFAVGSQCPKFDSQTAMRYQVNYSLLCNAVLCFSKLYISVTCDARLRRVVNDVWAAHKDHFYGTGEHVRNISNFPFSFSSRTLPDKQTDENRIEL